MSNEKQHGCYDEKRDNLVKRTLRLMYANGELRRTEVQIRDKFGGVTTKVIYKAI